ncbi:MAG TPA: hypothetical protein VEL76_21270, partial [Gemmataceae bacterium]|nr:hypothetical protein [Gemmataceae bacterium]
MPSYLICPAGHQWEAPHAEKGPNTPLPLLCPVCGSPPRASVVDPSAPTAEESGRTVPPGAAQGAETLPHTLSAASPTPTFTDIPGSPTVPGY